MVAHHRCHSKDSDKQAVVPRESLLDQPRANAGLMLPIVRLLHQRGITPCIRNVTPLATLDPPGLASDDVASFAAAHSHGLIITSEGSAVEVVAELNRALPQARICILSASRKHLAWLYRFIKAQVSDAMVLRATTPGKAVSRVVLGTFADVVKPALEFQKADIVLLLDAREALRADAQNALLTAGSRFRLFGMLPFNCDFSTYESARLMATFGPVRLEISGGDRRLREVAVAWLRNRPGVAENEGPLDSRPQGCWNCDFRNRRIARIAKALSDSQRTFSTNPKLAEYLSRLRSRRTAIVVANPTHLACIGAYLPHWSILEDAESLNELLQCRTQDLIADKLIITQEQLAFGDVHDVDIIIWAAGGEIGATSVRFLFTCPVAMPQPLLVVDCDDKHGASFQQSTKQRRRAYLDAGWFGLGVDPAIDRIDAFLRSQSVGT